MADQILHVLVIDGGLSAAGRMLPHTNNTRLQHLVVKSVGEAASLLRLRHVDAVFIGQDDLPEMVRLNVCTADLPVLMIARDDDARFAAGAIDAGIDDVLLPPDLSDRSIRRRVEIAIARKAAERRRLSAAREDRLTGLANSVLIEERFNRAMARADRFATLVGLVAIDLDRFDQLAFDYGQDAADDLLAAIGQRLLGETRQTDTLARTRDHGFTWLVEGLPAIDDISALVNRLPDHLARSFAIAGENIHITASVGVAICPFHGRDFQTVHGMAEAAMTDVSTISGDSLLMLPIPTVRRAALT
ncbi:MAG: GGDEF domain-containing protein [Pseudomonadota bacterium]